MQASDMPQFLPYSHSNVITFHAPGSPPDSNSYCDSHCEYGVELL